MRIISVSHLDFPSLIRPGQHIVSGQACGEPLTLLEKLAEQRASLSGTTLFIGASFAGTLQPEHADHLRFTSFGALGTNRRLARAGVLAMTSSGTESEYACAAAVSMLVRPGPEITKAAAGRPLERA